MIFDKLSNLSRYPLLKKLASFDMKNYKSGRFEIEGDEFFGIGLEYQTGPEEKGGWEAHRKYIDVHVILEGEEKIYVADISTCQVSKAYEADGDYELFEGKKEHVFTMKAQDVLVLYPNEVHHTSIQVKDESSSVKKIVFKILL